MPIRSATVPGRISLKTPKPVRSTDLARTATPLPFSAAGWPVAWMRTDCRDDLDGLVQGLIDVVEMEVKEPRRRAT